MAKSLIYILLPQANIKMNPLMLWYIGIITRGQIYLVINTSSLQTMKCWVFHCYKEDEVSTF